MSVDRFTNMGASLDSPFETASAVTPSDTADLAEVCRGLYIGGAGAVAVIMKSGATATFAAVPAGTTLRVRASRVMATNTTATNILALT